MKVDPRSIDTTLATPTAVRRLVEAHGFTFRKSLGQNFLVDGNILRGIIRAAAVSKDDLVIEIGAGIGTLTRALASTAGSVLAIEVDARLHPILKETVAQYDNVEIVAEDAMKVDWHDFWETHGLSRAKLVANLPYYLTSPLLLNLFSQQVALDTITVMIQKEVAQRFTAEPGTKAYGTLTVLAGYYSDVEICQVVPPTVFMPPPEVDSAIVKFTMRPYVIEAADPALFWRVVKAGFGQRRKTLTNALSSILGDTISKAKLQDILRSCDISPQQRAETLSPEDFVVLANTLTEYWRV
ncbi:MAG: 16S rRNA (adenine(1518)-N(6)/adenine(1519)-N(6))-dimethyltransferase RsmA [Firmicutes bacterium]|nr:16S rRNA (adenine(1518)-N(6)/adenine(1519)-N(6))-dimethyltransferase RsmA [Bacillota bacterium]